MKKNPRIEKIARARWRPVIRRTANPEKLPNEDAGLEIPADWPGQRRWAHRFLAFVIELKGEETATQNENIWIALRAYGLPNVDVRRKAIMAFDAAKEIARETGLYLPPEYVAPWERK